MKISILGYSGSGKSSLAKVLSKKYDLTTLHFDSIQFLENWKVRDKEEKMKIVENFLNKEKSWVLDGNYSKLYFDRRMEESDTIIFLLFNRFACLSRAYKRYKKYKNKTRPDMAEGCNEKFDLEFIKWILHDGRTKEVKDRYKNIINKYPDKVIIIKNQRELDKYINSLK